jgi:hypothetical protein
MNKDLRIAISGHLQQEKQLGCSFGELTAVPMISVKSLEEVTSLHFPGKP